HEVVEDALSFLTHWLAFHILDSDKRMSKTVLAMIQSNCSIEEAKQQADLQMGGATKLLIETILHMYDSLSMRTLELMREVTERQRIEAKLQLAANVFDNTLDAICITDENFMIIDSNPSFQKIIGLSGVEVFNKDLCLLKTGLLTQKQVDSFWDALKENGHWSGLVHSRHKDGEIEAEWLTLSVVKNEEDLICHYVAIFSNVSHLIRQQQSLEKMAHHDVLTGLPNRLLLKDRLKLAIAHAERTHSLLAVCYIDLDGFKPVNDNLGHIAGDYLLQEIAIRFLKTIRASDTVARLGGDEFVILLGDLKEQQDCLGLLDRVLKEVSQLVHIQNDDIKVSASIGVTVFPIDNSEPDILIHHADKAMYEAKRLGKSRYCLYQPEN
ncbi:partial putative signaling protein, partial [Patescibacteria group bacterium]